MWLSVLLAITLVFMLLGSIVLGGIFTIVLVPLAVLMAFAALASLVVARASGHRATVERDPMDALPHSRHANTAPAPSTPDELVDARQKQQ